jgi:hypothetical protein
MNKENIKHLTSQGIKSLSNGNSDQEEVIVQIVAFEPKKDKNYFYISDGTFKIKALAQDQNKFDPSIYYLIKALM